MMLSWWKNGSYLHGTLLLLQSPQWNQMGWIYLLQLPRSHGPPQHQPVPYVHWCSSSWQSASAVKIERRKVVNVLFNNELNTFYFTVIWCRTSQIVREETCCRHMGYSFQLTTRVHLYASSDRQDSTYYGLCYTSRVALAGTRNSSMGSPHEGPIRQPIALWANTLTTELHKRKKNSTHIVIIQK